MKLKQDDFFEKSVIFSSLLGLILSIFYIVARSPLQTDYSLIIRILGLSQIIIFSYLPLRFLLKRSRAFLITFFICITIIIAFAIANKDFQTIFIYLLVFSGFILAIINWIKYIRLLYLPIFFILSFWIVGVVWGSGFHHPLSAEGIALHAAHEDQIYESAIAQMIDTYGIPSTGLNGTPFIPYHFGSQWIILQFSKIMGTSPLTFYQLGYPIIFIPLFFLSFFRLVYETRKLLHINLSISWQFWIILSIFLIGIFPIRIIGILDFVIFYSESYLISVIFLFFLLSIFFHLARKQRTVSFASILIFMPASLVLMGLLKISTMYLLFSLYLYLLIRQKVFSIRKILSIAAISFMSIFIINRFISSQSYSDSLRFELFDFVKYNVIPFWKVFFIPYHYFFTLLYVYFRLNYLSIKTFSELKKNILKNKIIDLEILIILSVIGFIPGTFFHIDTSGAIYFTDIQKELAIVFLAAWVPQFSKKIKFFPLRKLITVNNCLLLFLIVPVSVSFYKLNFSMPIRNFFHKSNIVKNAIANQNLSTKSQFEMINLLQNLRQIPRNEKKDTLLFIPRSNVSYWNLLSCYSVPFVAPALSGFAMVDGIPQNKCTIIGFGYEYYKYPQTTKKIITLKEICRKIVRLGFNKIKYIKTSHLKDVKSFNCANQSEADMPLD